MSIREKREEYLAKLSPEERALKIALWSEKAREKRKENKEKKEKEDYVADRFRMLLNADYVVLNDENDEEVHHQVIDELVVAATANAIKNPRFSFKDMKDLHDIVQEEKEIDNGGVVVQIITNGQDLGD